MTLCTARLAIDAVSAEFPRWVAVNDWEVPPNKAFKAGYGVADLPVFLIGFAGIGYLERLERRSFDAALDGLAAVGDDALEFQARKRMQLARAIGEILIDAGVCKGGRTIGFFGNPIGISRRCEPYGFTLSLHHFADALFSAQTDLEGVGFQLAVLGPLGVDPHCH